MLGSSPAAAVRGLQLVGQQLSECWGLRWKLASCEVLAPEAECEASTIEDWRVVRQMQLLGTFAEPHGGSGSDIQAALRAVERKWWKCLSSKTSGLIPIFMQKALLPLVTWRCLARCMNVVHYRSVRALQGRLLARHIRLQRGTGESAAMYMRRRRGLVASLTVGRWPKTVAARIVSWREHLERGHWTPSWASRVLRLRSAEWYQQRRSAAGSRSVLAGCLGLRRVPCRPPPRWCEQFPLALRWRDEQPE